MGLASPHGDDEPRIVVRDHGAGCRAGQLLLILNSGVSAAMKSDDEAPACDGCPLVPRRDFLRDAGVFAAGVLVALGALPAAAAAAPVEFVSAIGGGRADKTYPIPAKDGTQ